MTDQEAHYLSTDVAYQFVMYYGETKVGNLIEENGKFYFVERKNIGYVTSETETLKKYGEQINLAAIKEHKRYDKVNNIYFTQFPYREPQIISQQINSSKLIILGAGASAGFSSLENIDFPKRPPLTVELFDDAYEKILEKFPGAMQLSSLTRSGQNLEAFFQTKWKFIKEHYDVDTIAKIINTQFYLQYLFKNIFEDYRRTRKSNYNILCEIISAYCISKAKQMMIVSFNYDTLFEQSLENSKGYKYEKIEDYLDTKKDIHLFKPHGSWNWIRRMRFGNIRSMFPTNENKDILFSQDLYARKVDYYDIFKNLNEKIEVSNDLDFSSSAEAFFPQLLIPFTDKDDFVMPYEHREILKNNLHKIDDILIIGWKGTEEVFKDLLKTNIGDKAVNIYVVNLDDHSVQKTMSSILPNANWIFYNSFSEFMIECQDNSHAFFE